jgi:hypothetical protein
LAAGAVRPGLLCRVACGSETGLCTCCRVHTSTRPVDTTGDTGGSMCARRLREREDRPGTPVSPVLGKPGTFNHVTQANHHRATQSMAQGNHSAGRGRKAWGGREYGGGCLRSHSRNPRISLVLTWWRREMASMQKLSQSPSSITTNQSVPSFPSPSQESSGRAPHTGRTLVTTPSCQNGKKKREKECVAERARTTRAQVTRA